MSVKCKYYNARGEYLADSREGLKKRLAGEASLAEDLLFSRTDPQTETADRIQNIRTTVSFGGSFNMIDGSPDLNAPAGTMTTQQFLDSPLFHINGEVPMFALSPDEYIEVMKRHFIDTHAKTPAEADAWGNTIVSNWNKIAANATAFHTLMTMQPSSSGSVWASRCTGTVFDGQGAMIQKAEQDIFREVMIRNGRDRTTGRTSMVLKNVNITAPLSASGQQIYGHIDYLIIRPDGNVEIYNIKTSTEPPTQWARSKMEKYRYQMALLKQMLAYHGIDSRKVHVNIVPVQIKYSSSFDSVDDLSVYGARSIDTFNQRYTFQKYDSTAAYFIDSAPNFSGLDMTSLNAATRSLQLIFPGKDLRAEGLSMSARDWVLRNWRYCNPTVTADGKLQVTINLGGVRETLTLSDMRRGADNEELVRLIADRMEQSSDPFIGQSSASVLVEDIRRAFQRGYIEPHSRGTNSQYIQQRFSKYLSDYEEKPDGTREYRWTLCDDPVLLAANIIMFRHKSTGQCDVFSITNTDPGARYKFKGRENLLGAYIPDQNRYGFVMESNYGNMDAIRVMALLNELLPDMGGTIRLGELQVIGMHYGQKKQGVHYDFDTLLHQWDSIVRIVNGNNPAAPIRNRFREENIECMAPEEVLRQLWMSICDDTAIPNRTEIRSMEDIFDGRLNVDGSREDGLSAVTTVEAKVDRLVMLQERIEAMGDTVGLDYRHPDNLLRQRGSVNPTVASLAKLYIAVTQARAAYQGDMALNNEQITSVEDYLLKPTSNPNTSVRQVVELVRNNITAIRQEVISTYMDRVKGIVDKYYRDCGYGALRNALIGNQASCYNNLYQVDESGHKTFEFKNPYDNTNDLKPHEREFLKNMLFEFYKVRCAMQGKLLDISGTGDSRLKDIATMPPNYLYVPLQRASSATRMSRLDTLFGDKMRRLARAFRNPKAMLEENMGWLSTEDTIERDNLRDDMRVYNPYTRSEMSLEERDKYIREKGEAFFETNVENLFIDFMAMQKQCAANNSLLTRLRGIELLLKLRGEWEGDDAAVNRAIKSIDEYLSEAVFNKSIMEESAQKIETYARPFRHLGSFLYIAGNLAGAVRDTIQGLLGSTTAILSKYKTDIGFKDLAFAYKEVITEGSLNTLTITKLNQFNIKYGLSNFDAAKVAERLKSGRSGVMNFENAMYYTLRSPDYMNRMTLFVATLHKIGAYDAYSLDENGRLVYDWRKDKRFSRLAANDTSDMGEYNRQKSLYYSLIRAFNQQSGMNLAYTDDLPDALTDAEVTSIKSLGETLYGAYDMSTKEKATNTFLGRNFMVYFTWMNGIIEAYWNKPHLSQTDTKYEQQTDYNGNKLFFTPDNTGNTTTVDTGIPVMGFTPMIVQGIIQTYADVLQQAWSSFKTGDWKAFFDSDVWTDEINRRNFRKSLTDGLVALLLGLLFRLVFDPAYKEHKKEMEGRYFVANAFNEILYRGSRDSFDVFRGPLNVIQFFSESTRPMSMQVMSQMLKSSMQVLTGEKGLLEMGFHSQAFLRGARDSYDRWLKDIHPKEETVTDGE